MIDEHFCNYSGNSVKLGPAVPAASRSLVGNDTGYVIGKDVDNPGKLYVLWSNSKRVTSQFQTDLVTAELDSVQETFIVRVFKRVLQKLEQLK